MSKMNSMPNAETYQQPQPNTSARVLIGNATNFTRVRDVSEFQYYRERPLLVEAWAQTTLEDFDLVGNVHRQRNLELQCEVKVLLDKVRVLEQQLGEHVRLLNQIHRTAAPKAVMPRTDTEHVNATPTPPVTPILQQQNVNHQHLMRHTSPNSTIIARPVLATQTYGPQVINAAPMKTEGPNVIVTTGSTNYRIVSNEENDNNCEPIEIQLAEEDGALNLNSSADSGRLEICLGAEEQIEQQNQNISIQTEVRDFKEEEEGSENSTNRRWMPPLQGMLIKRRKLQSNEETCQVQQAQYNNGYGSEISSTASVICQPISNELLGSTSNVLQNRPSRRRRTFRRPSSRFSSESASPTQSPPIPTSTTHDQVYRHNDENVMMPIGPNNTLVPVKLYDSIKWDQPSQATRKLLMALFKRETLATHSMTGKPSPAFKNAKKPPKQALDKKITDDIVFAVSRRCKVSEKEVRTSITTKCADENKMMKQKQLQEMKQQHKALREQNKENQSIGCNTNI